MEIDPDPPEMLQEGSAKPRTGGFYKGQPGGPGRPPALRYATVSKLLLDYRHVANKAGSKNESPGRKALRKLLESQPKVFMENMQKLELEHEKKVEVRKGERDALKKEAVAPEEAKPAAEGVEADAGTERALTLIEEWKASRS